VALCKGFPGIGQSKSSELFSMSHVRLLTLLPDSGEEHSKHWRMIQLIKVADSEIVAIPSGISESVID
jgi:hypothetical protein